MLKIVWIILLSIFLLVYFYMPYVLASQSTGNLETLQNLTQKLYKSISEKDYEKSKLMIEEISLIIPQVAYDDLTSIEGIEVISFTVIQTKRSLAALEPKYELIYNYTNQLYLAIDALGHQGQPLWHRYHSIIGQDIGHIRDSLDSKEANSIQSAMQNFNFHYQLIKPAATVDYKHSDIEKIDSLIKALLNQTDIQHKEQIINQLDKDMQQLFFGSDKETLGNDVITPSIMLKASLGMGLIIFIALSYVTWRKFRGDYLA